jgi:Kinesin motor domain
MLFKEDHGGGGGPPAEIVAAPLPPGVVVSASTTTSNDNEQRKTHIEVCIRIRPMLEGSVRESSNGFLLNNNNNSSASSCSASSNTITANNSNTCTSSATPSSLLRRSSISRLPSLFRPTSSSSNNTNTPRKQPPEEQNQSPAAAPPAQYAWKVEEDPDNHGGSSNSSSRTTVVRQTMNLVAGRTHQYTLDHVYGPTCHTSDVYQHSVQDLVHAAMDGYHTSVLAYGQTSTGKTHTITGTAAQPGILPRAVRECFAYLNNNNHTNNAAVMGREYLLRVSYLEVYKENIRDLLAITSSTTPGGGSAAPTPIRLFEAPDQGLIIKGLREQVVSK